MKPKRKKSKKLPIIVTKTYKGTQDEATKAFKKDTAIMARKGYRPTTQNWSQGTWGCGTFLFAAVACLAIIGILIFIYLLIVKPAGILTVTYELREVNTKIHQTEKVKPVDNVDEKICPECAEKVKAAAKLCRYCRYQFE